MDARSGPGSGGWRLRVRILLVPLTAFLFGAAVGCGGNGAPGAAPVAPFSAAKPIQVLCTTGMVADAVQRVGGERVAVTQLMGEGVDPHLYKASPGDIRELNRADVVFYSGLHLEGKLGEIFAQIGKRKPTYPIAERLPKNRILEVSEGYPDPHVWFDVSLWSGTLEAVVEGLSKLDAEGAAEYRSNAEAYRKELDLLHAECTEKLAKIPPDRRVLVTAHDAFHYFGRAYHLEVKAIQGISTESEAGVKEINELVKFLSDRKIKAVFVETSVSNRNITALVEGCQANGHAVKIGGELFSDSMGKPGTPEGTYPGMVRHNVDAIVKALE